MRNSKKYLRELSLSIEAQTEYTFSLFFSTLNKFALTKKKKEDLIMEIFFSLKKECSTEDPLNVVATALFILTPFVGVIPKRIAGSTFI